MQVAHVLIVLLATMSNLSSVDELVEVGVIQAHPDAILSPDSKKQKLDESIETIDSDSADVDVHTNSPLEPILEESDEQAKEPLKEGLKSAALSQDDLPNVATDLPEVIINVDEVPTESAFDEAGRSESEKASIEPIASSEEAPAQEIKSDVPNKDDLFVSPAECV